MVNLDGIQYFATIPIGLLLGVLVSLLITLAVGSTWWILMPPAIGLVAGIFAGKRLGT